MHSSNSFINVIVRLMPFFNTIILYYFAFIPDTKPSVIAMCIKCAPIISLIGFVMVQKGFQKMDKLSKCILWGLVFSCGGDAFLIWPDYFLHGMVSFAVAQLLYISAFGFQTMRFSLAVPLFTLCFYVLSILLVRITDEFLVAIPVYAMLLATMCWRASARAVPTGTQRWSWIRVGSSLGALSFLVSDAFIAFDRFHSPIPNVQFIIMTTYYLAQFGIALSVLDSTETVSKKNV